MRSDLKSFSRAAPQTPPFFDPIWAQILNEEFSKPYFQKLLTFVASERQRKDIEIYPPEELTYNAFAKTPYDAAQVVIVGQDPYHGPGQAEGLCFSVPKGIPFPPSLRNIFQELQSDLSIPFPTQGSLENWAKQGVLLLNTTLTVRQGQPLSHAKKGWEEFTDAVLLKLAQREDPPLFVLWGQSAQKKYLNILSTTQGLHCLVTAHPSPLSAYRGFFGCRHFSQINLYLAQQGKKVIDWQID